jgi:hypothetical protein
MIPAALSLLHTVHILVRPAQPLSMARSINWNSIVDLRNRHHEIKLSIADLAKKQKASDSFSEYMRHEDEFHKLVRRDDHYRKKIAKLLTKYFEQQGTHLNF